MNRKFKLCAMMTYYCYIYDESVILSGIRQMVHLRCDEQRLRVRPRQSARRLHQGFQLHRVDRQRDRHLHAAPQRIELTERRIRIRRRILRRLRGCRKQKSNENRHLQRLQVSARRVLAPVERVQWLYRMLRWQRRVAMQQKRTEQLKNTRPRLTLILIS